MIYVYVNMSVTINGLNFHETPCSCGSCPALLAGRADKGGFCTFFEIQKWKYNNVPSRCKKLFNKGFQIGGNLVIVIKS